VLRPVPGRGVDVEAVIDEAVVGAVSGDHALPITWQHGGTSLTLGYDRGLPVCDGYVPPFRWTGTLHAVRIDAGRRPPPRTDVIRTALQAE
jgi:hypothetical protein